MLLPAALSERWRAMAGGLPQSFWVIWAGTFVNRCGSFVLPFMAIYLTEARQLSIAQAGLVLALYGAGGAVAGPLGGWLADHAGRRATLIVSLVAGGLGMIGIGSLDRIEAIAPAMFLVATITEMYRPAMQAAVADLVPPSDRVRAYGLVYWVINLGFAVGLAVGGLVATRSFQWLFWGDGATTVLFGIIVWLGVPETRPRHLASRSPARSSAAASFFAPYRDRWFVAFLVLTFLFALLFMQNATTFPLDMTAHGISKATFGWILGLNGLLIVLIQPLLGPFLTRFNRSRTLAVGSLLTGLGFGLNALASTAPMYALGVIVWTVGEIGVLPVANALVADLAPPWLRGRYQGAIGLAFGLAVCLAPVVGTMVLQRFGSVALWIGCLALGAAIAVGHQMLAGPLMRLREERLVAPDLAPS